MGERVASAFRAKLMEKHLENLQGAMNFDQFKEAHTAFVGYLAEEYRLQAVNDSVEAALEENAEKFLNWTNPKAD